MKEAIEIYQDEILRRYGKYVPKEYILKNKKKPLRWYKDYPHKDGKK